MSTKTREELQRRLLAAVAKGGPVYVSESIPGLRVDMWKARIAMDALACEVASVLAELADQRQPDERVTGTPCTGAEFVAAAQSAISPRSDEDMQDIIASVTGEPAPVEATPPGEVVTDSVREVYRSRGWRWNRDDGGGLASSIIIDQLEAVRRAREADARTIAELRQQIEGVANVLGCGYGASIGAAHRILDENYDLRQQVERLTGLHIGERDRVILERYFGVYRDGQCGLDAICRVLLGRSE